MKAVLIDGKEVEVNAKDIYNTSYCDNVIIIDVGKRKGKSTCYLCRSIKV